MEVDNHDLRCREPTEQKACNLSMQLQTRMSGCLTPVKVKQAKAKSNSLDFFRFLCANSQNLFRFLCANSLDLLSFFLVLKGMKTKRKNQTSKGPGRCFFLCVCAAPPDEPHPKWPPLWEQDHYCQSWILVAWEVWPRRHHGSSAQSWKVKIMWAAFSSE